MIRNQAANTGRRTHEQRKARADSFEAKGGKRMQQTHDHATRLYEALLHGPTYVRFARIDGLRLRFLAIEHTLRGFGSRAPCAKISEAPVLISRKSFSVSSTSAAPTFSSGR